MSKQQTHEAKGKKTAPPPQTVINNAVATQESRAVTTPGEAVDLSAWGVGQLTAKDIMIPKIFAMQAMSKEVTEGRAKFGEFRDSLNQTLLGDTANPIEVVPFYMEKVYVVMELKDKKFSFKQQVPITAANEDHEFECDSKEGIPQKWYRTQNFYVLFPKDVLEGVAIPHMLSFRSSSARAGQKIAAVMFMKNLKAGKTPASMVLEISAAKTTNDKGTFIVLDAKEKRPSSEKEVAEAFDWVKTVKSGQTKVDHSDLEEEVTNTRNAGPAPENPEY